MYRSCYLRADSIGAGAGLHMKCSSVDTRAFSAGRQREMRPTFGEQPCKLGAHRIGDHPPVARRETMQHQFLYVQIDVHVKRLTK